MHEVVSKKITASKAHDEYAQNEPCWHLDGVIMPPYISSQKSYNSTSAFSDLNQVRMLNWRNAHTQRNHEIG